MAKTRIVVIGGVAAGPKAAARARRLMPDAEITIIERGQLLSYSGCGMPYYIEGMVEDVNTLFSSPVGVARDAVFFKKVKNIDVRNQTLATKIDRKAKTVEVVRVDTGQKDTIPYDKLVIATGGLPFVPPIEGINANRVFQLNHPDQAVAIRDAARSAGVDSAVIIGAGLIGMEVTEALAANGLKVIIVEMFDQILPKMLDFEMAAFLTKHIKAKGVNVYTGEKVLRIETDSQGNVRKVITDKREIEAQMVLTAVGVRPNVQLAKDAGLEIGPTGGVKVDEYMLTSDPDIYAAGDCAETINMVCGEPTHWPMGSGANKQGRVIANNIAAMTTKYHGHAGTGVCKVFDFNVGKTGLTEKQAIEQGYEVVSAISPSPDITFFLPMAKTIIVKLIADAKTGKLLGGQVVGPGDAVKRTDILATALHFGANIDQIGELDLGYAPPYSNAIDVLAHVANTIQNKRNGLVKGINPIEVKARIDRGENFIFLDVRTQKEYDMMRIEDPRIKLIPLGRLRERYEELPKDKEIIAFCKVSLRAYEASRTLAEFGYDNVSIMDGGVVTWPYDIVTA